MEAYDDGYDEFLSNTLYEIVDDISVNYVGLQQMWFIHDGEPAHFSNNVRQLLNNSFRGLLAH